MPAFKVQTRLKEPAAVAWTFEFVLGGEPARRATQMGAFGKNGVDAGFFPNDPDPLLLLEFFTDFANSEVGWQSCFEGRRGLKENSWNADLRKPRRVNPPKIPKPPHPSLEKSPCATRYPFFFFSASAMSSLSFKPTDKGAPDNENQPSQHQYQPHRSKNKRQTSP